MFFAKARLRALIATLCFGFAVAAFGGQAALAASYVDPTLKDVPAEAKAKVAAPQPVQILFQFQTDGAPNDRATKMLKQQVIDTVKASGAFSEVSEAPVANGAVVSVTLNNVVKDLKDATAQGFVTGLTFGLKGSLVTDHYICTVEYVGGPDAAKISSTVNHAIHTTLGIKAAPEGMVKSKNILEAVMTMTRQAVSNSLNQVALDPAFAGAPATAPAPADAAAPAAEPAPAEAPAPAETPAPTPAQ
jgi:hypothetical protein